MQTKQATILLIEGRPGISEILQRNLDQPEYKLLIAGGTATALAILRTTRINLVIQQWDKHDFSAAAFLDNLSQNYPEVAVLLVTDYVSVSPAQMSISCLPKPFTAEELLTQVRSLI